MNLARLSLDALWDARVTRVQDRSQESRSSIGDPASHNCGSLQDLRGMEGICSVLINSPGLSVYGDLAGCLVQIIADVVENLLKAPLKALLWASGKPYKNSKVRDEESQ